jgi:ferredoxin
MTTVNRDGRETAAEPPEPVHVRAHPGLCVGWGECHRWAPNVYPLDEFGQLDIHVMEVPSEHAEDAWWGASACPARAITVIGPPEQYWFERLRRRQENTRRREQERGEEDA